MKRGQGEATSTTVKRSDLKPKKERTDAQLLASAMRAAERWTDKLVRDARRKHGLND